jgi:hypothetical protein
MPSPFFVIVLVMIALVIVASLGFLLFTKRRFMKHRLQLWATVTRISSDEEMEWRMIGGKRRAPFPQTVYKVEAQWVHPETRCAYTMISRRSYQPAIQVGDQVMVTVDPGNVNHIEVHV